MTIKRTSLPCQFCVFHHKYCHDLQTMYIRESKIKRCSEGWNDGINAISISEEFPCNYAIESDTVIELMKKEGLI